MGGDEKEGHRNQEMAHVLFIPHPSHGHFISAVLLSKQLVRQGIRVTLISHKPEIDRLLRDEDSELETMGLLQFVGLPRPNMVTESPREASILLQKSFKAANMLDQLSGSDGPTCILSDLFIFWSTQGLCEALQEREWLSGSSVQNLIDCLIHENQEGGLHSVLSPPKLSQAVCMQDVPEDLALQLHIRRYTFIPSGAVLTRFLQATEDLFNQGTLRATADDSSLEIFYGKINIPGLPALQYHELPVSCRHVALPFMLSSGILMNTFYELEALLIVTLRNLSPIAGQNFYPISPLFQNSNSLVEGLEDTKAQCIRWLDAQPDSSVLYICFGTLFRLNPVQIKELALGLERSKHRFLWVLLDPHVSTSNNVKGLDPDQVQVLSHPSTGGFLTHCGWNSCLEAVSKGVSMLAWPISADQHLNCRYLVDELKVASEVPRAVNGIVQQEEVEKAVRLFMKEERLAMRGRMDVLKLKAATALADGGSATYALQQFAQDLKYL